MVTSKQGCRLKIFYPSLLDPSPDFSQGPPKRRQRKEEGSLRIPGVPMPQIHRPRDPSRLAALSGSLCLQHWYARYALRAFETVAAASRSFLLSSYGGVSRQGETRAQAKSSQPGQPNRSLLYALGTHNQCKHRHVWLPPLFSSSLS